MGAHQSTAAAIRIAAILTFLFLCSNVIYAESQEVKPFTVNKVMPEEGVLEATVAPSLYSELKSGGAQKVFALPVPDQEALVLELEQFSVLSPDVKFYLGSPSGNQPLPPSEVLLYQGHIAGDPSSLAYLSISPDGVINGFVEAPIQKYVFSTPRENGEPAIAKVMVQRRQAISGEEMENFCGVEDLPQIELKPQDFMSNISDAHGPLLLDVAIDADHSYNQMFPTITGSVDYIVQQVGAVSAIYQRELQIRVALRFARIWASGGEPFNINDLEGFRQYWWNNEDTSGYDLVSMWSANSPDGYAGVAYITNTCDGNAYSICATMKGSFTAPLPAFGQGTWDVNIVAHEWGHNLSAYHTPSYGLDNCETGTPAISTIMSYCHTVPGGMMNLDMRMHRVIEGVIRNSLESAGCQPFDCNGNNRDDALDINYYGSSLDVNDDGIPDECQDCNMNGILDPIDIVNGYPDVDFNGVPDGCENDCGLFGNGYPDRSETKNGLAPDEDGNFRPDNCDPDCNSNGWLDYTEININIFLDVNRNRVIDNCEDCNSNGKIDFVDLQFQKFLWAGDAAGMGPSVTMYSNVGVAYPDNNIVTGAVWDVAVNPVNRLVYIAATDVGRVYTYNPVTEGSVLLVNSGTVLRPSGIAFKNISGTDYLFVADNSGNKVARFNASTGAFMNYFVPSGSSPMTGPIGIAFGTGGDLFVTSANNAVYRYNGTTGAYIGQFVAPGSGGLSAPRAIAFSPYTGNLLVMSSGSNQLLEYSGTTGAFVKSFADPTLIIENGWGVEFGPDGWLYISKGGSATRIWGLDGKTGNFLISLVRGSTSMFAPTGFAFMPYSTLDVNHNDVLDACEVADYDGDGVMLGADNCPYTPNALQTDSDGDGVGDACDNCVSTPNADQRDYDLDYIGDVCDNCPNYANVSQFDYDYDGRGNPCDNCPEMPNPQQEDSDWDFIGDVCDACPLDAHNDDDGDGICGDVDNCPTVPNPGQEDWDGDGKGDPCDVETAEWDNVATPRTKLMVGSDGSFGRSGNNNVGGANLDYAETIDCDPNARTYLYDGTPVIGYLSGNDTVMSMSGAFAHTSINYEGANPLVHTVTTPVYDIFKSGTFVSPDSSIGTECWWYAPKQVDSSEFVIQAIKVYSFDGVPHSGVMVGEFIDWDIPSDFSANNTGGSNPALNLVYQIGQESDFSGCQPNDQRRGGMAYLGYYRNDTCNLVTSVVPHHASVADNLTWIFSGPLNMGALYNRMQTAGFNIWSGSPLDLHMVMTMEDALTLNPGDTVVYYAALSTVPNGTADSLNRNIQKARQWLTSRIRPTCGCCVGTTGNVNTLGIIDLADLSMLVAYLTVQPPNKPTLPCTAEANVNGTGIVDLGDLSLLVAYLTVPVPNKPVLPNCP